MPFISAPALRRRHFLQAGAACALAAFSRPLLGAGRPDASDGLTTLLRPGPARVRIVDSEISATEVWTYNGVEPGPVLRLRQGTAFRATVENRLAENTTVHWHGIRLPNAMDGVPGITQQPIPPGGRFEYAFTPPDAGTFWYHSHDDSLVQMGRGLAGPLIVEEPDPPAVDRDLLWTIQDRRLESDAQIAPGFNNRMEIAMDGRVGSTVTINGRVPDTLPVRAGERIRLRLLNAAIARIMPRAPAARRRSTARPRPRTRSKILLQLENRPGQTPVLDPAEAAAGGGKTSREGLMPVRDQGV